MSKQIITINRMFGSNGRVIGKAIADALGLKFYDKELIEIASREKGVPFDEFAKADEKKASQWRYSVEYDIQIDREYHFTPINDVLFDAQKEIILNLADKEDCVIVGRAAGYAFRNRKDALRIFLCGEKEKRIERMMDKHGFSRRKAVKIVEETDDLRRGYHEYYSGETWGAAHNYDICLDVMRLGKDRVMHIIDTALAELIDK